MGGLQSWAFPCGSNGKDSQLSFSISVKTTMENNKILGKLNNPQQKFSHKSGMRKKKVFKVL